MMIIRGFRLQTNWLSRAAPALCKLHLHLFDKTNTGVHDDVVDDDHDDHHDHEHLFDKTNTNDDDDDDDGIDDDDHDHNGGSSVDDHDGDYDMSEKKGWQNSHHCTTRVTSYKAAKQDRDAKSIPYFNITKITW